MEFPLDPLLTPIEARVLGALMEKQLTTPDAYPLTLNSLLLACNQKTSREPVSHYESGEVQRCINELQERKLVEVDWGARAARYDQRLTRVVSLDKAAQALLCVMMLRGPQTLSELLTRTQRMFDFGSTQAIEEKLQHLCVKTHPAFMHIPRLAGQREDRYMHLLSGAPDLEALAAQTHNRSERNDDGRTQLEERVTLLENQLAELQAQVARLLEKSAE
ncbi:YceH family protein [Cellvibrio japonicus]|uniref:UPF0502 protein CJA_1529 n=1 Tax=Cellvibrio japonicus (strain Ueda107) TaxID=498211 RepID=Y1529_CELJU|nr:YceH family protein [Cellvibrio japonicus]B3PE25.1 RecName: Full=UPF0502 protein CJA_1529 [Cellvibrio japonicus Ueda107]ACE84316.1 conserved hypothetical protein [Cellvibrio japonicus Ueda107]QEI12074.1 DUF480 domain-containing protein [Cellvibrio japonicus]QEI15648.1 DUF480 domain-containing protein [Cellvibrio japonicus]QEI19226.1 DUF480 domain-containing protein [Cellvibrio japonicus]